MQEMFGYRLALLGHKVTWLITSSNASPEEEPQRFGFAEVEIISMMPEKSWFAKMINYIYFRTFINHAIHKIVKKRLIDIVFVRNHVRAGFSAYRICKKNNIPFVFYLGYPILESHRLSARRGYRSSRLLDELAALVGVPLRHWVTRKADFVFAMSNYWREQVINELNVLPDRIKSFPAGFDPSNDPDTIKGTKIRKKFHLKNNPTIFYMGAIGPPRDNRILADTLAKVVQHIPDVRLLLLYGHGEEKHVHSLQHLFAEKKVKKNVVFAPPVPHKEVHAFIAASDVGLSPIETIPLYKVSSPHKTTEMLGMGCPVVASNIPDHSYVLRRSQGGLCVSHNANDLAEAVVYILTHPDEAKRMGKNGRALIIAERSYDVLADQVEDVFLRLDSYRKQTNVS